MDGEVLYEYQLTSDFAVQRQRKKLCLTALCHMPILRPRDFNMHLKFSRWRSNKQLQEKHEAMKWCTCSWLKFSHEKVKGCIVESTIKASHSVSWFLTVIGSYDSVQGIYILYNMDLTSTHHSRLCCGLCFLCCKICLMVPSVLKNPKFSWHSCFGGQAS